MGKQGHSNRGCGLQNPRTAPISAPEPLLEQQVSHLLDMEEEMESVGPPHLMGGRL